MPTLTLLSGNIASGKSTLARRILATFPNTAYINDDDLYYILGGGDYSRGWAMMDSETLHRHISDLALILLQNGKDVLIDLPAINEARREHFVIDLGESWPKVEHILIEMERSLPLEHAIRRHKGDARGRTFAEWHDVAKHFDMLMKSPGPEERKTWRVESAASYRAFLDATHLATISQVPSVGPSSSSPATSSCGCSSTEPPTHPDGSPNEKSAEFMQFAEDHLGVTDVLHPDSGASPGEYATEDEWDAFRLRQFKLAQDADRNVARNALGSTDRGENGCYKDRCRE